MHPDLVLDSIRFVLCVASLWLAALVTRLGWLRKRNLEDPAIESRAADISPLTYLSYAGALVLLAAQRVEHIGEPLSWDFFVAAAVVALGMYGVVTRTRFNRRSHKRGVPR